MFPINQICEFLNDNQFIKVGCFNTFYKFELIKDPQWIPNQNPYDAYLIYLLQKNNEAMIIWSGDTHVGTNNRLNALTGGWNGGSVAGVRQKMYLTFLISLGYSVYLYERPGWGDGHQLGANNPYVEAGIFPLNGQFPLNGRNVNEEMFNLFRELEILNDQDIGLNEMSLS